jgi:hypothetical protein
MKLQRWLLISMLGSSALALLTFAGWWWVTWPERTARHFVALLGAGRIGEARALTRGADDPRLAVEVFALGINPKCHPKSWAQSKLRCAKKRSCLDLLRSRATFKFQEGREGCVFTVQMGDVIGQLAFWSGGSFAVPTNYR